MSTQEHPTNGHYLLWQSHYRKKISAEGAIHPTKLVYTHQVYMLENPIAADQKVVCNWIRSPTETCQRLPPPLYHKYYHVNFLCAKRTRPLLSRSPNLRGKSSSRPRTGIDTTKLGSIGPHYYVHYKGWKQKWVPTRTPILFPILDA